MSNGHTCCSKCCVALLCSSCTCTPTQEELHQQYNDESLKELFQQLVDLRIGCYAAGYPSSEARYTSVKDFADAMATEIDVLRADVARYEAEAQKLRSSRARYKLEMQLVEDVLDGAEISGVFMDYWGPVHDRISALKGDLKAMTSFADLWYFVTDKKPLEFEKIVTEWMPAQWMHQAYLLKERTKK